MEERVRKHNSENIGSIGQKFRNSSSNDIIEGVTLKDGEIKIIRFKKKTPLGCGRFANCYLVEKDGTGEQFACKIISKEKCKNDKDKQMIYHEIEIQKNLNHPGIVKYEVSLESPSEIYIFLELCDGKTLDDLLTAKNKRLSEDEVRSYMKKLIEALKYIHSQKIIHRDLKLKNLLLTSKGELKIGDFGLATKMERNDERRKTICGTPDYIAPEILDQKEKNGYSYEVDIWSVGIILYTLLFGNPPFQTRDKNLTYQRIKEVDYTIQSNKISKSAEDLIKKILKKEPTERLTLDKILKHEFFIGKEPNLPEERVKKWVDYSTRFGLGYLLNNGYYGAIFNDNTKIILDPLSKKFNYIDDRDNPFYYNLSSYNEGIKEKIDIFKQFICYLNGRVPLSSIDFLSKEEIDKEREKMEERKEKEKEKNIMPYIKKWIRTQSVVLFHLSCKIIQACIQDGTEIILLPEISWVIYINKELNVFKYTKEQALDEENKNEEMKTRYKYVLKLL